MKAVMEAVKGFTLEARNELWPRFTAKRAGVSTAEAREAMLDLAKGGLLDLWYVVISDAGDEVGRYKYPDEPPLGSQVTSYRSDEPETFTVDDDDVYLMFSPTEQLEVLVGAQGGADPKVQGAGGSPSAPVTDRPSPDELARSSDRWNGHKIELHYHEHHHHGDDVRGDKFGGDRVEGDKFQGDKVEGDKQVGPRVEGDVKNKSGVVNLGDENVVGGGKGGSLAPASAAGGEKKKGKKKSGVVIGLGLLAAVVVAGVFVWLGDQGKLEWAVAIPLLGIAVAATLAVTNLLASHVRG